MKELELTNKLSNLEFLNKIKSGKLKICVIGIGRIGLPTALSFANSGLPTIGLDNNQKLVNIINSGKFPLNDEPGFDIIFDKVIKEKRFRATTNFNEISFSDVIILSLPTSIDSNNIPDYSALLSVLKKLHDTVSRNTLIVIESTVEPGFVEEQLLGVIEDQDNNLRGTFVGVCPENANPGQILDDFKRIPRLVGAIDEVARKRITDLYKHVFPVDLIQMPDCKTANAVKLTTNIFRDLNIALVNELAIIFEKAGIDIMVVLEAAKSKYNFQVHYPSSGVGGPCLPVNSYQMINFAKKFGYETFHLVEEGRKINEKMPLHTIALLEDALKEANKRVSESSILVLGASYKPDVKSIQISPIEQIIQILKENHAKITVYDPYYKNSKIFGIKTSDSLISSLENCDAMIIATPHKEFYDLKPTFLKSKMRIPIVIDSKCILDQHAAKEAGLIYRAIGRGKI